MDWPFNPVISDPPVLNNASEWLRQTGLAPLATSAIWTTASQSVATMVRVRQKMTVKKLYAFNGAAVSGNACIGLYQQHSLGSNSFDRLITSGSVGQAGVSQWQEFNTTDTVIGPGIYWLAYNLDNITGQVTRLVALAGSGLEQRLGNVRIGTATFLLPNPETFVTPTGDRAVPLLAMGGVA